MSNADEEHHQMQSTLSGDKKEFISPNENKELGEITNQNSQDDSKDQDRMKDQSREDVKIVKRKVKRNGFSLPLHTQQIISWFVFTLDTYAYFFINIVTFSYQPAISVVLGVVYLCLFIAVLYYAVVSTKNDPTDPTIYLQKDAERMGVPFDNSNYQYYCEVCESHVSNDAKHCGQCNRCVNGFDHHCRWLNNCVGQSNYKQFFRLICFVFALTVLHCTTDAAVLFYINTGDRRLINQNMIFYRNSMQIQYNVILAISMLFNTATILFLGHLISFHIFLQTKKLTTFEYIQLKLNRQNHKSKIFREVNQKEEQEELDKKNEENQQEIETDNNLNLHHHQYGDDESYSKDKIQITENLELNKPIQNQQQSLPMKDKIVLEKKSNKFRHCFQKKKKINQNQQDAQLYQLDQNQLQNSSDQQQQNTDRSHVSIHTSPLGQLLNEQDKKRSILSQSGSENSTIISGSKGLGPANDQSPSSENLQLLSNDNHILSVITFGAGDNQSHVQYPGIKQQTQGGTTKSRKDLRFLLNKKQDLETIQEKVKEEDVAAMSVSHQNMKNIDIEESYSFSMRNFQPTKNTLHPNGHSSQMTRNSQLIRNEQLLGSQQLNSEDFFQQQEHRNTSFQRPYSENAEIEQQFRQLKDEKQETLCNTEKKKHFVEDPVVVNNNFVDHSSHHPKFDYTDQTSVVEPINNRFTSHNNFGDSKNGNKLKNISLNDPSSDYESMNRNSNQQVIPNAKLGKFNSQPARMNNQWVNNQGSVGNLNQMEDIAESIVSAEDEYNEDLQVMSVQKKRINELSNKNSFVEMSGASEGGRRQQNLKSFI